MTFQVTIYDHNSQEQIKDFISEDISKKLKSKEVLNAAGNFGFDSILYLIKMQVDDILIGDLLAERFLETIKNKGGKAVLGLFTGSTPEIGYARMVELTKERNISWKDVITFNMDEYVGLLEGHPERYDTFMWEHLFNKIDILKENIHFPGSDNWREYDAIIKAKGGIDHQEGAWAQMDIWLLLRLVQVQIQEQQ